jgi:hypothetical protein
MNFIPTTYGATTTGYLDMYFDGSDVGLANNDNEDVTALFALETTVPPTLFLNTFGNFSVTGVSGANEDVFVFNPASLGFNTAGTYEPALAFDGSRYGLSSFALDGIHIGALPSAGQAAVLDSAVATSVALPLAATLTSYRPDPGGNLSASASNVSVRAELAADALAAVVLKSPPKKSASSPDDGDCGCHSDAATGTATLTAGGPFTIWDVLGEMPADNLTGQLG